MKLKQTILSLAFLVALIAGTFSLSTSVEAATRIRGYTTRRGTYVMPHYRSTRDSSRFNNYSTRGNYNPYTGKKGYTSPYKYKW